MADVYARTRARLALVAGLRATALVSVALGALAFTFAFVFRNLSTKILAGKWAPDSPLLIGLAVGGVVLGLGVLLSLFAASRARIAPESRLKIGGQVAEVRRWVPPASVSPDELDTYELEGSA